MTKARRVKWAGLMAHTREKRNAHQILVGKPERRNHLVDLIYMGT
jgi:hypothetical protein